MHTIDKRILTGSQSISEAFSQEMDRDERVFVLGEDVGVYGGIHGTTKGLLERFGPERIRDTPISELGFVGAAIGAAAEGMRPIVELMLVDFFGVCMDQIYNHMAKFHYMSGGNVKLPMVIMTAVGAGNNCGAQHSQTLYATFAHLLGMKVIAPSTPYDMKGMMIAAIRDENPVVFMFHKSLLGLEWIGQMDALTGHVPEGAYTLPLDKAKVVRKGKDITIVGIQMMTHAALFAAKQLEKEGIDAEVIDLRSLVPIDKETILHSVRKTNKLLIVDEDYMSYGMTAEVAAIVAENALFDLKAPVRRLAIPNVPIPFSRPLENFILPDADKIFKAAKELVLE